MSRELDGGVVVLNTVTDEAHHLEGDVAEVWRATVDGGVVDLDASAVARIVEELGDRGLLAPVEGATSRRSLLRAGALGGAAVATAGIQTIALPSPAFAGSNDLPFSSQQPGVTLSVNVPAYVNAVTFSLNGGGGAGAGRVGGNGSSLEGTIQLPPGRTAPTTLEIKVGDGGKSAAAGSAGGGGFSTGGSGSGGAGGGGGSSSISVAGVPLVVAAGGGGSGASDSGALGGRGGNAGIFNTVTSSASVGVAGGAYDTDGAATPAVNSAGGTGGRTANNVARSATGGTSSNVGIDGGNAGGSTSAGGGGAAGGTGSGVPGGGGGAGWAGGGGGQAGKPGVNGPLSAAGGGGGGSSMFRSASGCTVAITAAARVGNGGPVNGSGTVGSVSVTPL